MAAPLIPVAAFLTLAWLLTINPASTPALATLFFVVRTLAGFNSGANVIANNLAREVATDAEQFTFEMITAACSMLGMSIGPVLCSIALLCGGGDLGSTTLYQIAAPMAMNAALYGFEIPIYAITMPLCKQDLQDDVKPLQFPVLQHFPSAVTYTTESSSALPSRTTIVCLGILIFFTGNVSCISMESGTSLLLELQYEWPVAVIGLCIAAVFGASSIVSMIIGFVIEQQLVNNMVIVVVSIIFSLGGTSLLFNYGSQFNVLIGDALVYPCVISLISVGVGNVFLVQDPRRWYNQSALNYGIMTLDACLKLFSSPFSRAVISAYGRNAYATMQLMAVSVAAFVSLVQLPKFQRLQASSFPKVEDRT